MGLLHAVIILIIVVRVENLKMMKKTMGKNKMKRKSWKKEKKWKKRKNKKRKKKKERRAIYL